LFHRSLSSTRTNLLRVMQQRKFLRFLQFWKTANIVKAAQIQPSCTLPPFKIVDREESLAIPMNALVCNGIIPPGCHGPSTDGFCLTGCGFWSSGFCGV
jgi:hypothetical protein